MTIGDNYETSLRYSPWFRSHADMAQTFWPKLPIILEGQHGGVSEKKNAWVPTLLLKAVEDYHASFTSIHWWPRKFLEENGEIIDKISRRLGCRLMPTQVSSEDKWNALKTSGNRFGGTVCCLRVSRDFPSLRSDRHDRPDPRRVWQHPAEWEVPGYESDV